MHFVLHLALWIILCLSAKRDLVSSFMLLLERKTFFNCLKYAIQKLFLGWSLNIFPEEINDGIGFADSCNVGFKLHIIDKIWFLKHFFCLFYSIINKNGSFLNMSVSLWGIDRLERTSLTDNLLILPLSFLIIFAVLVSYHVKKIVNVL